MLQLGRQNAATLGTARGVGVGVGLATLRKRFHAMGGHGEGLQ
jgi:hypothetical protein